jgi:hypothetical protein
MPVDSTKRDQTLKATLVDEDALVKNAIDDWTNTVNAKNDFLERKIDWQDSWRDTAARPSKQGPFPGSANFKSRLPLSYGKAVHARLWQLFSNPSGFFAAKSRQEVNQDKEVKIEQFMNWVLDKYVNSRNGVRGDLDRWLWDVAFEGNGFLKCYWKKEEHEYRDIVQVVEESSEWVFDEINLTGQVQTRPVVRMEERVRKDVVETPQVRRLRPEDVLMPIGQSDPQESDWVAIKCPMTSDDIKDYANQKIFFKDAAEIALSYKESFPNVTDMVGELKEDRLEIDGIDDTGLYEKGRHVVIERYCKAFVETSKGAEDPESDEALSLSRTRREIVYWVHVESKTLLGWTYLHRISPGGIRPIFKADYVVFPDRTEGAGVPELIFDEVTHIEALRNLRFDNGILASTPFGFYRASSSGLKPAIHELRPGQFVPTDDPQDVRVVQFPYMSQFGVQEESILTQDIERKLTLSDLQLGITPQKVGALRNATGANYLAGESNIQLEIHFDRIARCMSRMLQFLFRLCRERMPAELYYRVENDIGTAIFGKVNREDLKGEFDFDIRLDILGQTQSERQQQSVLMMQTLMNPAFLQTGVVTPSNIYELAKNFLRAHKIYRVQSYLSEPPEYQGEIITPHERIYRIVVGRIDDPRIEDTVRLGEDHEKAIKTYEDFKKTDEYGLFTQPAQIAALEGLIEKHGQMLAAQQAQGMLNQTTGMQLPRDMGQSMVGNQIGGGGTPLQPEVVGQANGPVV